LLQPPTLRVMTAGDSIRAAGLFVGGACDDRHDGREVGLMLHDLGMVVESVIVRVAVNEHWMNAAS
jgi:hypothetical protein